MGTMLIRTLVILLCVLIRGGFDQTAARIQIDGIGASGTDFSFSAVELADLPQRTVTASDH